ncbi:MAG: hypothetical protein IJT21_09935 [Synergistaceae bacterium]|nr:hypothetical protein [Synergistaceae bacterium]
MSSPSVKYLREKILSCVKVIASLTGYDVKKFIAKNLCHYEKIFICESL